MTNPDDVAQLRRTVRALELLADSYQAHQASDQEAMGAAFAASAEECPVEWNLLQGGMRIGEVPQPGDEAWPEYLATQQARLAELNAP
jgi:hypothetical protein